jgi:hypothetical protein
MYCWISFSGVKRPQREAIYSTPSNSEVKNAWKFTFTPLIRLHGVVRRYMTLTFNLYCIVVNRDLLLQTKAVFNVFEVKVFRKIFGSKKD